MIEVKKRSEKVRLWNELCDLVQKGKEITFVWSGINYPVNERDNEYFLNYGDKIAEFNYIKDIDENRFMRMNKLQERMTIKEIKEEIVRVREKVSVYENMNEWQRLVIAASARINSYNRLINKYENEMNKENGKYRGIYLDAIRNMKENIKKIENKLVKESA